MSSYVLPDILLSTTNYYELELIVDNNPELLLSVTHTYDCIMTTSCLSDLTMATTNGNV